MQEVNASVATGRRTKSYEMHALSGLCYCADCGSKMRRNGGCKSNSTVPVFMCGTYSRYGKEYCSTHTIRQPLIESLVLADIQKQIDLVINEPDIREKLLTYKKGAAATQNNAAKKKTVRH